MNFGYRRISQILCEKGFTTVRSNKPILNNFVHSIYKRGKTREERNNRGFQRLIQYNKSNSRTCCEHISLWRNYHTRTKELLKTK